MEFYKNVCVIATFKLLYLLAGDLPQCLVDLLMKRKQSGWQVKTLCNWPNLIFWNYNKENIIPRISSLTQYSPWMISIEISQCARSSCQPGKLKRPISFHFTWKLDYFYVIIVSISVAWLNICQLLVMWYLSSWVLCSHLMTSKTLAHICNTLNDTCCIQFRIHSRFHQVYRQLGVGGRLIAITVILPFLMCHRYLQLGDAICTTVGSRLATQTVVSALPKVGGKLHDYTLPEDTFWWNTCRWSVPHKSLYCLP